MTVNRFSIAHQKGGNFCECENPLSQILGIVMQPMLCSKQPE